MSQADSPPGVLAQIDRRIAALIHVWVSVVRRRPWLVLVVTGCLIGLSALQIRDHLSIRTDTSAMLSPDLPFQRDHARFKAAFPALSDDLIVVIDGATPALADQAAQTLNEALARRPDRIESTVDIAGLPYFRQNGFLYLSPEALGDLSATLTRAQPFLAGLWHDPSLRGLAGVLDLALGDEAKANGAAPLALAPALERLADATEAVARGEPGFMDWSGALGTTGGTGGNPTRRFLVVKPVMDHASLSPAGEAMDLIRETAHSHGLTADAGVRVRLTGSAALAQDELGSVRSSIGIANSVSLALVALLLAIGLRSGRLITANILSLVTSLTLTAGFAALAVGTLNLISVAFAILSIGLSDDFGLHFGMRYREALARGRDNGAALDEAALTTGAPLTLSALAAGLAFFSFLPTDYLGLAQLGLISGVSMGIALMVNLTLQPAFLTLCPVKPSKADRVARRGAARPVCTFPERHPRIIVLVSVLLGCGALGLSTRVHFDTDPLSLKDPQTESLATLYDVMNEPGFNPYSIDILAPNAAEATRLSERLKALPEVKSVVTLPSLIPTDQSDKLALIDELAFVLGPSLSQTPLPPPDDAARRAARDALIARLTATAAAGGNDTTAAAGGEALARAAGRLAAALRESATDGPALARLDARLLDGLTASLGRIRDGLQARPVTLDDLPPALRDRYQAADGSWRLEVFPKEDLRDPQALHAFVDAIRPIAPEATGAPVIIVEAGRTVLGSFAQAGGLSTLAITVLLALVLRRFREIVLVFAPVLLAGLLTLGASVILDEPFNLANVIVLPLLAGLGVGGAIHVVGRASEEGSTSDALESSTPKAVLLSSLTTVFSFGSIALSTHVGMASMGVLLTLALTLSLLTTLVFLPALMASWPPSSRQKSGRQGSPASS